MNRRGIILIGVLLLATSSLLALSVGTARIPLDSIAGILISRVPFIGSLPESQPSGWETIVMDIRLPVVIMAMLAGAALSASGASLQGLFKNPLVDPFIIGISAGGAFGWVLALIVTIDSTGWWVQWFRASLSFAGAITAVTAAYLIARTGSRVPVTNLLLAGVAISASLTAATQFGIYLLVEDPRPVMISLLGTCSNSRWAAFQDMAPVVLISLPALIFLSRDLNAFSMGEEEARGVGVNVERSKFLILAVASLLAAVTVPFCGMIGFVGLMVPHMVRRFMGPDHRWLIPGSFLFGSSFLILCDMFSRSIMDRIVPLGMVTGFLGGLFFLYLIAAGRRSG
ncbi:MAG: iron ABC transporter permease [Thermoplasmata archaeon]|nr:MAG: iron ABC transporter permease [Thermoplasmata archaeon]